ncbi:hypothetical protein [Micromonospora cathayae]|uniref:Uncharacterized protein n=1 Tax=Micromonospora cathayae TaxID=3028804 RepID=A0ABY7ZVW4_9ACTN|nr:hypothetical protein [Micromonospora sp. HUAS 3]WDZ87200.1 hypothetical protein PVK37_12730 [Micromonospora sp. HUAS 3]
MRPDPAIAEHYRQQFDQTIPSPESVLVALIDLVSDAAQSHDDSCTGCGAMCAHLQHAVSLIAAVDASCLPPHVLARIQQRRSQSG